MSMARINNPNGKKAADRKFSWSVVDSDGQKMLLVDSSYSEKSAAEFFTRFRPNEDPYTSYEVGYAAYDVAAATYKIVEEKYPGAFQVYIFYLE